MKKAKKIVTIIFAAMMIITSAACGGNSAETYTSAENTTSAETEQAAETEKVTEADVATEGAETVPDEDDEEDDEVNETSGFVLPSYKMAVIESNSNFISVAIAFDPSVTMFGGVKLQTYSGDVTFGRGDLDSYYVDSGEDGWYENITGELQTKEPNGVALSSKSESALVVVCRYEVSSQVDTDDFYLTSSNVKYTDTDGSRQYSKNENIFTVNASIEELPVNPSFAIEGPLICEEGAYYLMSSTTNGTSGTKDEMYYCTISAELYALNESTNGVHLADIHLIDSRTMEEFVIPDGFEIYASGEYKNLGNVSTPNDNDATIRIGISGSKDMESEINDFFRNEILVYGLIGYDSDDGLVVYFCQ